MTGELLRLCQAIIYQDIYFTQTVTVTDENMYTKDLKFKASIGREHITNSLDQGLGWDDVENSPEL